MADGTLPFGLAYDLRRAMTGAIWDPAAVRATTDVTRALAVGAAVTLPGAALDAFAGQMVFGPGSGLGRGDEATARWLAAAVIVAFATGGDRAGAVGLAQTAAGLTVQPPG
jgi:hypothetical protein